MAGSKNMGLPERHPFVKAFPRAAATVKFIAAVVRLVGAVWSKVWPYRRELTLAAGFATTWAAFAIVVPTWWALGSAVLAAAGLLAIPEVRGRVRVWRHSGRTRRWLTAGLRNTRMTNLDGRLPRIGKVETTRIGERLVLRLRPGQSHELMDTRVEELRAALRSRDVRLHRDPHQSHLVTVDVVRVDPLTDSGPVAWADQDADVLSIWDPVHFGISELGEPVRLSLVERAVLIGGNRGAGKSSLMNLLVAHAAKSPDAELLLIDANRVQLGPWRDRALAFADHDADAAIAVLELGREELDRRLDLFTTLPGVPVALTRELSHQHKLPMWLLFVDEMAYHTSVAGTPVQQKYFYATLRDIVARGRASGITVIAATQRPTHDLIPTSLRDLFDIRVAYRTMTRTSSDVILGDDFAKRGFVATDIDLNARGVNWLFAEGRDPIRTKSAWISPEARGDLAVTTVRHRPSGPRAGAQIPNPRLELEDVK